MTERGMGAFGLPTMAATLSTVAVMAFFACLFSQGSLGTPGDAGVRLNLAFADIAALQRDVMVMRTRQASLQTANLQTASLNVTDIPRTTGNIPSAPMPTRRPVDTLTIRKPVVMGAAPAAVTPNVRVASLDAGIWQSRELHHIVPYDEPLRQARTKLVPFQTAPFPYSGKERGTEQNFLNVSDGERQGHRSWRGGVYWAN